MDQSFIFRIAESTYGLPARAIQQTLVSVDVQPVPWMPAFHRGLFALRGEILPLLDLRRFIHEKDTAPEDGAVILIVDTGTFRFGTRTGTPRFLSSRPDDWTLHPMASLYPALDNHGTLEGDPDPITMINPERLAIQLIRALQTTFSTVAA